MILHPKDSGITWDMLTHRVTTDLHSGDILDCIFTLHGEPEDGNKTAYVNALKMAVDTRAWFLCFPEMR